MTRALVVDAHLRASLAGIRGLAQAGVEVLGLASRRSAAGLWSKFLAGRTVDRNVESDAASLWRALERAAGGDRRAVVYPGQEWTVDALQQRDSPNAQIVVPYGSLEGLKAVRCKAGLADLAAYARLTAPSTIVRATAGELKRSPPSPPFVVKPVRPGRPLATARLVESPAEMSAALAMLADDEPLLLQERVGGPLMALGVVIDSSGRLTASFQQVAKRTWPVQAGASSVAVSVPLDKDLAGRAAGLLHAAGYVGLAELQFLLGPGGPALIDVNPRFYGSLSLAVACGVNLPAAWHALVTGEPVPSAREYRLGVSYRWLEGDLLAALFGSPRRILQRPARPRVGAVWSAADPLPGAMMAVDAIRERAVRRLPWRA